MAWVVAAHGPDRRRVSARYSNWEKVRICRAGSSRGRRTKKRSVFGRIHRSLVGLDIGSSAVKVVELRRSGTTYSLVAAGVEPLPHESVIDGAIVDAGVVSDAIRRVYKRLNLKTKEVSVSLSGHAVIVKKISLPLMPDEELRNAIQWEARQHIPFDRSDVDLDYQVMEDSVASPKSGQLDVLLVAAKKEKIQDYTAVVSQAGCVPVVLDVDAFALQNAYELNAGVQPERVRVLVNAGASSINLNVVRGRQSVFTRDVAIGGNAYSEALQRELNLPFEDADRLKKGVSVGSVTCDDAEPVIRGVTQHLLQEVSKTLDFFRETAATDRFDGLMLSGGTAGIEGFAEALADRFEIDVQPFDPFGRMTVDPRLLGPEKRAEIGPVLAVATGLALRRAGDR